MFDESDQTWRMLTEHCQQRIGELTELCIDPDCAPEVRQSCAVRIDELRSIVSLPRDVQEHRAREARERLPVITGTSY